MTNVSFELGDIYELPYPDASFDAAFAHNVLVHLSDPLQAMKEMRGVLKPAVATVLEHGWADQASLDAIAADLEAWGEDQSVFAALMVPTALGWAPEQPS